MKNNSRLIKNIIMITVTVILIVATCFTFVYAKSNGNSNNMMPDNNQMGNPPSMPGGSDNNQGMPGGNMNGQNNQTPPEKSSENSSENNSSENTSAEESSTTNDNTTNENNNNMNQPSMPSDKNNNSNMPGNSNMPSEIGNNQTKSVSILLYVLFGFESFAIALLVTYLLMSKFNKKSFKETLNSSDKVIILILSIIVFGSVLTGVEGYFAKKTTVNNNNNINTISTSSKNDAQSAM